MADEPIRVGLIGAGGNVRNRHIPGFQGVEDCEIVAVANRSIESGRAIADQFNIPRVYGNWRELLEDEEVNAVCIGTWPYTHRTMTLAALEAGKHVLTEARMANTAQEARDMLAASLEHPELVCQLTPTSTSYTIDNVLKRLIEEGHLGELLSVDFTSLQNNFADLDGPLHWRHDRALSGHNTLNIGASYESMMRWLGRGNSWPCPRSPPPGQCAQGARLPYRQLRRPGRPFAHDRALSGHNTLNIGAPTSP